MRIVPVIDIRHGVVVRAIAGRRADYRPLVSRLTSALTPLETVRDLLAFYPFENLYIADLDAIEGRSDNGSAIRDIGAAFPELELWIDPGLRQATDAARWRDQQNLRLVVGSESISSLKELCALTKADECILSLDFQGARFLGDPEILEKSLLWPSHVIVMTLTRVGGDEGPDIARLAEIVARANGRAVFGAGGVRYSEDFVALAHGGATGVLVSSALHDGRLTAAQLASCATLDAS
jgi:HisA/HisF family protein